MPVIFLVDDDEGVRRATSRALRQEGFEVRDFESAEAFLERADVRERGCIVLDVSLPGLDGFALQARLTQSGQSMPIVFLTGRGDIPMSVRAIKSGATDFLTKPVPSAILVAAVREALRQDEVSERCNGESTQLVERFESLSARERQVLGALINGRLNKQIAIELGVVEQTIKFHRTRIMERMQARTLAELMHMAAKLEVGANGTRRGNAVARVHVSGN